MKLKPVQLYKQTKKRHFFFAYKEYPKYFGPTNQFLLLKAQKPKSLPISRCKIALMLNNLNNFMIVQKKQMLSLGVTKVRVSLELTVQGWYNFDFFTILNLS